MRKRITTFPLTTSEKNDVARARVAFNKALRDAGAEHVAPLLTFEFTKTLPVTERAGEFILTITADDKHSMLDEGDAAVLALQHLAESAKDVLPNLKLEDDPVRLSYAFAGNIDLHTPKIVRALRSINIPKASI